MSNLVLYTADDFETSDMPVNDFTGVYAWLTGYKVIGLMDLDNKDWLPMEGLNINKELISFYGKSALKNYLDSKMELCLYLKENDIKLISFFHNAKYDFSYIQHMILNEYGKYDKGSKYYLSKLVIDENNTFYSADINKRYRKRLGNGKRKDITLNYTIKDLYKILPSKLEDIGSSVGVKKLTEDFNYELVREYDYIPNDKEMGYFYNDIEIMVKAYRSLPAFFYGKYTIGSIVKSYFLDYINKDNKFKSKDLFPSDGDVVCYTYKNNKKIYNYSTDINYVYDTCLNGYKGGMTLCNNDYLGKTLYNDKLPIEYQPKTKDKIKINSDIYYLDVNSLYPSVTASEVYPIGVPYILESDYESNNTKELYTFLLKESKRKKKIILDLHINSIQVKKGYAPCWLKKPITRLNSQKYDNTITEFNTYKSFYTTDSHIREIISLDEFILLQKNYNIIFTITKAIVFDSIQGLFTDFIYQLNEKKVFYDKDEFLRNCFKLCMNNLYGKFGEKVEKITLKRTLHENGEWVSSSECEQTSKISKYFYPPIALFITSYARMKMINFINMIGWNSLIYMDTDSLNVIGKDKYDLLFNKGLVDSVKLGFLKLEKICYAEKILSPKKYCFYGNVLKKDKDMFVCKCAGLPDKAQKEIEIYALNNNISPFDKFAYGLTFVPKDKLDVFNGLNVIPTGKLSQRYVYGGIKLSDGVFSINTPPIVNIISENEKIELYNI